MAENTRGKRKKRVGIVVSDKMDKTVTVKVSGLIKDPVFKKYIVRSRKFMFTMRQMNAAWATRY